MKPSEQEQLHNNEFGLNKTEIVKQAEELLEKARAIVRALLNKQNELVFLDSLQPEKQAEKLLEMKAALQSRDSILRLAASINEYFSKKSVLPELRKSSRNKTLLLIKRFLSEKLPKLENEQSQAVLLLNDSIEAFAKNNPAKAYLVAIETDTEENTYGKGLALPNIDKSSLITIGLLVIALLLSSGNTKADKNIGLENEIVIDLDDSETVTTFETILANFDNSLSNIEQLGTTNSFIDNLTDFLSKNVSNGGSSNNEPDTFKIDGRNIESGNRNDTEKEPLNLESPVQVVSTGENYSLIINTAAGRPVIRTITSEVMGETLSQVLDRPIVGSEVRISEADGIIIFEYQDQVIAAIEDIEALAVSTFQIPLTTEVLLENNLIVNREAQSTSIEVVYPKQDGTAIRGNAQLGTSGPLVTRIDSDIRLTVKDTIQGQNLGDNTVWYEVTWLDGDIERTGFIHSSVVSDLQEIEVEAQAAPTPPGTTTDVETPAATGAPIATDKPDKIPHGEQALEVTPSPESEALVAITPDNVPQTLLNSLAAEGYEIISNQSNYYVVLGEMAAQLFFENGDQTTLVAFGANGAETLRRVINIESTPLLIPTNEGQGPFDPGYISSLLPIHLRAEFVSQFPNETVLGPDSAASFNVIDSDSVFRSSQTGSITISVNENQLTADSDPDKWWTFPNSGQVTIFIYDAANPGNSSFETFNDLNRDYGDIDQLINILNDENNSQVLLGSTSNEYLFDYFTTGIVVKN